MEEEKVNKKLEEGIKLSNDLISSLLKKKESENVDNTFLSQDTLKNIKIRSNGIYLDAFSSKVFSMFSYNIDNNYVEHLNFKIVYKSIQDKINFYDSFIKSITDSNSIVKLITTFGFLITLSKPLYQAFNFLISNLKSLIDKIMEQVNIEDVIRKVNDVKKEYQEYTNKNSNHEVSEIKEMLKFALMKTNQLYRKVVNVLSETLLKTPKMIYQKLYEVYEEYKNKSGIFKTLKEQFTGGIKVETILGFAVRSLFEHGERDVEELYEDNLKVVNFENLRDQYEIYVENLKDFKIENKESKKQEMNIDESNIVFSDEDMKKMLDKSIENLSILMNLIDSPLTKEEISILKSPNENDLILLSTDIKNRIRKNFLKLKQIKVNGFSGFSVIDPDTYKLVDIAYSNLYDFNIDNFISGNVKTETKEMEDSPFQRFLNEVWIDYPKKIIESMVNIKKSLVSKFENSISYINDFHSNVKEISTKNDIDLSKRETFKDSTFNEIVTVKINGDDILDELFLKEDKTAKISDKIPDDNWLVESNIKNELNRNELLNKALRKCRDTTIKKITKKVTNQTLNLSFIRNKRENKSQQFILPKNKKNGLCNLSLKGE